MPTRETWDREDAKLASDADSLRERLIREEAKAKAANEPAKPFDPSIRNMLAEGFHQERQRAYEPQRDFGLPGSEPDTAEITASDELQPQTKPTSRPKKGVGVLTEEPEN